ncbi:MAG: glycerophosphodiester phosphodiesterase [Lachnospiraceae bacterium]|nr:glycerophosphodiester phosphodiesterase [Lachnospiraceae bacterium]
MILNFAHRGFSGRYPENTMLAYEKAVEAGCDGIELDVHLSADGEPVLIHDERVDRTSDGVGFVGRMTLKELRALDVSAAFRGQYGVNRVPTLREYLAFAKDAGIMTNIELKTGVYTYPGIEAKTLELIDEFGLRDKILFSSFNHYSVKRMQALAPEMTYGLLEESRVIGLPDYTAAQHVQAVHPEYHMVDEEFMESARNHGLLVNVWTVNTEYAMRRLAALGVDMMIGNNPDICTAFLKSLKQS